MGNVLQTSPFCRVMGSSILLEYANYAIKIFLKKSKFVYCYFVSFGNLGELPTF